MILTFLTIHTETPTVSAAIAAERMTILAKGIKDILTSFAKAGFVSSFTLDEEDIADKIFAESSFIEVLTLHSI